MNISHTRKNTIAAAAIRAFLNHTDAFVFVKDYSGRYVNASEPFLQMTGHISLADIVGHTDFEILKRQKLAKRYQPPIFIVKTFFQKLHIYSRRQLLITYKDLCR